MINVLDIPTLVGCLSVRQPWAHLLVRGWKDCENRTWPTGHRGLLMIHASSHRPTNAEICRDWPAAELLMLRTGHMMGDVPLVGKCVYGALVGWVYVTDCTKEIRSKWHMEDQWGIYVERAGYFAKPIPYTGKLGIFTVELPLMVREQMAAAMGGEPSPPSPLPGGEGGVNERSRHDSSGATLCGDHRPWPGVAGDQ